MYQKVSTVPRRALRKIRNRLAPPAPVAPPPPPVVAEPAPPPLRQGPHIGLDDACDALRGAHFPGQPLFEPQPQAADEADSPTPRGNHLALPGGLHLNAAPEARISGYWASPRGQLLELKTRIETGGRWLGLHIPLPAADFSDATWLVLALRSTAAQAMTIQPCLRSGLETGFRDDFFPRAVLVQSQETEHLDMLALDRPTPLPRQAPWRELVLFLPPATDMHLVFNHLRLASL